MPGLPAFLQSAPLGQRRNGRHAGKAVFIVQATVHEVTDVPVMAGQCSLEWRLPQRTFPINAALAQILAPPNGSTMAAGSPASAPVSAPSHATGFDGPPAVAAAAGAAAAAAPASAPANRRWNRFLTAFPRRATANQQQQQQPARQTLAPPPGPPRRSGTDPSLAPNPTEAISTSTNSRAPSSETSASASPPQRRKSIASGRSATDPLPLPPASISGASSASSGGRHSVKRSKTPQHVLEPITPAENRGSTPGAIVRAHLARFERTLTFAVRVPINRPGVSADRATDPLHEPRKGTISGAAGRDEDARSASARSTIWSTNSLFTIAPSSDRERHDRTNPGDDEHVGVLAPTWLHLNVVQRIPQDESGKTEDQVLGHANINLAEYVPPARSASRLNKPETRTETRKFLLAAGKTNALLRVTLSIRRVAASEYYVLPPISSGIPVAMWRPPVCPPTSASASKPSKAPTVSSNHTSRTKNQIPYVQTGQLDGSDSASAHSFGTGSLTKPPSARTAPPHLVLPGTQSTRTRRPGTSGSGSTHDIGRRPPSHRSAATSSAGTWANPRRTHGSEFAALGAPTDAGSVGEAASVIDQIFAQTFADACRSKAVVESDVHEDECAEDTTQTQVSASASNPHLATTSTTREATGSTSTESSASSSSTSASVTSSGAGVRPKPKLSPLLNSSETLPQPILDSRHRHSHRRTRSVQSHSTLHPLPSHSQPAPPLRWSPNLNLPASRTPPSATSGLASIAPEPLGPPNPHAHPPTPSRRPSVASTARLGSRLVPPSASGQAGTLPSSTTSTPELGDPWTPIPLEPEPQSAGTNDRGRTRRSSSSSLLRLFQPRNSPAPASSAPVTPNGPSVKVTPPSIPVPPSPFAYTSLHSHHQQHHTPQPPLEPIRSRRPSSRSSSRTRTLRTASYTHTNLASTAGTAAVVSAAQVTTAIGAPNGVTLSATPLRPGLRRSLSSPVAKQEQAAGL